MVVADRLEEALELAARVAVVVAVGIDNGLEERGAWPAGVSGQQRLGRGAVEEAPSLGLPLRGAASPGRSAASGRAGYPGVADLLDVAVIRSAAAAQDVQLGEAGA